MRGYEKEGAGKEEAVKKAAKYCRNHDILKEFLDEGNASEVINMLMTEWNWDDALAVRYEEGMERGVETVARNALAQGLPIDVIQTITGLDKDAIIRIERE